MEKHHNGIYKAMGIIAILLIILAVSMFNMMVVQGADYYSKSQAKTKRTLTTVAERGSILDTNGIPLAYDKKCYNVNFYMDPLRSGEKAMYSEMMMKTIDIVESHGGTTIDTLNIVKDDSGNFSFDWKIVAEDDSNMTEEEKAEQQKSMEKLATRRHELWCGNMGISKNMGANKEATNAKQAYMAIRQRFAIPDELSYEEARKVLSIWQEVQYLSSTSYKPVTIATDVDMTTVAELTERSMELDGFEVEESFIRVYPHGETAAHIVGYMSKQYDEALEELKKKDYPSDATAGISGIEATMEEQLSSQIGSRSGERIVEVNSRGKIVREIESTPAQPGNDVQLTIDYELQLKVEETLAEGIKKINEDQKKIYEEKNANPDTPDYYIKKEDERGGENKKTRFAETGAAVVINVKTGQILALASFPSFDPNQFVNGISEEDYAPLLDKNTTPLFNKAVSSKAEPGSIFKMVTGYAAITDGGVDPEDTFPCLPNYIFKEQQADPENYTAAIKKNPTCSAVKLSGPHQPENLISGMRDSCNNYFYALAEEAGIDNIKKWGDAFGLSTKTNIELTSEATGYVASPEVLYDNTKAIDEQKTFKPLLVQNKLKAEIKQKMLSYFQREASDAQCQKAAEEIMKCMDSSNPKQEMGEHIRRILREQLDIPESMTKAMALDDYLNSILYELKWTSLQTIWTGIGQSTTAVTPVAVARYIAAIANGGTVYDCNIVKRITDSNGSIVAESNPKVFNTITDTNNYLSLIQLGMNNVTSVEFNGTAADAFVGFDEVTITDENGQEKTVVDVCAKTGTAQVSGIDIENTAWFVGYTPFEAPEIAVVVYIPNGFAGWRAAPIGRDIMEYYRDKKDLKKTEEITTSGSLLP